MIETVKEVSRSLAGMILPLLAVVVLMAACYKGTRPAHIGEAAPDFTVQDSDRRVTLSDFRGKVVVLNFWATWCPPCVEEMPSLVDMQSRMRDHGITVVAVSLDKDESAYRRFIEEHRLQALLTIRDPEEKSNSLYGTHMFPETYIIDPSGIVRRKFIGAVQWNHPEILEYLEALAGANVSSSRSPAAKASAAE
jgi:cytochrome c biogenesis protein CcmG/thiol:disulfide interchange protein DsbE